MTDHADHDIQEHLVQIPVGSITLAGNLIIPPKAQGIVVFAHGSGSSRMSPRNRLVANVFNDAQLGTLLFDLLTPEEEHIDIHTREYRFDVNLLAQRMIGVTYWLKDQPETKNLTIGYFGASTGAAAALIAAAKVPQFVSAVVSRGGRPDLADGYLAKVQAPTMLIVGGYDHPVIEMNESAFTQLPGTKELTIIRGATHLFEEPGTLAAVAHHATMWFTRYLVKTPVR